MQQSKSMEKAFEGVKATLAAAMLLAHPIAKAKLALVVDAWLFRWTQSFSSGCCLIWLGSY